MRTFNIHDLNRSLAKVLAAADCDGVARVRSRDGRVYVVRPEKVAARKGAGWASFARARQAGLKKLFPDGPIMTAAQVTKFDRLLADDRPLP